MKPLLPTLALTLASCLAAGVAAQPCGRTAKPEGDDIRVAFLTDLHITPGNDNDSIVDLAIDEINADDYDLVVIGGDMTNMGSDEELGNIHRKLARLRAPQIVVAGNHETTWSESACTEFRRLWGHDSRTYIDIGNYRFVGYQAGPFMKMADGTVRREDLRWVDSVMTAAPAGMRIVSVCHYPLSNDLTNRSEVTAILRAHDVCATLCGHYHEPSLNNYDSIPGILGRALMLRRNGEPTYGYSVLRFADDSIHVREKIVGEEPTLRYVIRQGFSRETASLPCDPPVPPLDTGGFDAQCVIDDDASIYTDVAANGDTIYYGNSAGYVKAYDHRGGRELWRHAFSSAIYSSPIYYEGTVIVATVDDGLSALDAVDGHLLWCNGSLRKMIGDGVIADDALYIGVDGAMMRIDPADGEIVWRFDFGRGQPQGRPTVADGKVVFGAWDCHLYCLDTDNGELCWKWSNGSDNRLLSPGHIVPRIAQGRVMIVAPDRHMTFIDLESGRQLWRIKERRVRETTGLSDDGEMFYAKTMDGEMIAVPVSADSYAEEWVADAGWGYDHSFCPIATRDGMAYMANRTGMVAAVDLTDGHVTCVAKLANSSANNFTVDANGDLWVSFIEGKIYRIGAVSTRQ